MGAAVVEEQMDTTRFGVAPCDLAHAPEEMGMVVFLQTPAQHRPIRDIQGHPPMHDPSPLILNLPPLHPPRGRPLGGSQAAQGLDGGFFIHTDHQFAPAVKPLHVLITPNPSVGCLNTSRLKGCKIINK